MLSREICEIVRFAFVGGQTPHIIDWNNVIKEMQAHAIVPVLGKVKKKLEIPNNIGEIIDEAVAAQVSRYIQFANAQQEIIVEAEKLGIMPAIIKGMALAQYYDFPSLRTTGDIDILLEKEPEFNSLITCILKLGYKPLYKYEGLTFVDSLSSESRHLEFAKDGIEIEIHSRYVKKGSKIDDRLECTNLLLRTIDKWSFYSYPTLENGIILLIHIRHHLSCNELGLRPVVDWLCYANKVLTNEFWDESFCQASKEYGVNRLAIYLTRICELYFNLPKRSFTCEIDDSTCESLFQIIANAGNFGTKYSSITRSARVLNNPHKIFFHLQNKGVSEWEACKKHKFLIPFAWLRTLIISIFVVFRQHDGIRSLCYNFKITQALKFVLYEIDD